MRKANKSFEIETAEDYLNKLVKPSFANLTADRADSKAAVECAIFTWHLHEWIWAQYKPTLRQKPHLRDSKHYERYIFNQCPELSVIQGVATGSKHFDTERKEIGYAKLEYTFISPFQIVPNLIVEMNGKGTSYWSALKTCIDFWESFLSNELGIEVDAT